MEDDEGFVFEPFEHVLGLMHHFIHASDKGLLVGFILFRIVRVDIAQSVGDGDSHFDGILRVEPDMGIHMPLMVMILMIVVAVTLMSMLVVLVIIVMIMVMTLMLVVIVIMIFMSICMAVIFMPMLVMVVIIVVMTFMFVAFMSMVVMLVVTVIMILMIIVMIVTFVPMVVLCPVGPFSGGQQGHAGRLGQRENSGTRRKGLNRLDKERFKVRPGPNDQVGLLQDLGIRWAQFGAVRRGRLRHQHFNAAHILHDGRSDRMDRRDGCDNFRGGMGHVDAGKG